MDNLNLSKSSIHQMSSLKFYKHQSHFRGFSKLWRHIISYGLQAQQFKKMMWLPQLSTAESLGTLTIKSVLMLFLMEANKLIMSWAQFIIHLEFLKELLKFRIIMKECSDFLELNKLTLKWISDILLGQCEACPTKLFP